MKARNTYQVQVVVGEDEPQDNALKRFRREVMTAGEQQGVQGRQLDRCSGATDGARARGRALGCSQAVGHVRDRTRKSLGDGAHPLPHACRFRALHAVGQEPSGTHCPCLTLPPSLSPPVFPARLPQA